MAKPGIEPKRARLLELIEQVTEHAGQLRDYGSVPGNTWLARGELQNLGQLVSDLESLLEEIRVSDEENGF